MHKLPAQPSESEVPKLHVLPKFEEPGAHEVREVHEFEVPELPEVPRVPEQPEEPQLRSSLIESSDTASSCQS